MEKSVRQARWMLGPIFGLGFAFMLAGGGQAQDNSCQFAGDGECDEPVIEFTRWTLQAFEVPAVELCEIEAEPLEERRAAA